MGKKTVNIVTVGLLITELIISRITVIFYTELLLLLW